MQTIILFAQVPYPNNYECKEFLNDNYSIGINDSIYYTPILPPFSSVARSTPQKVEADPTSFQIFKYYYAKDKNNVFYKGQIILEADQKSFEVFDSINSYQNQDILFPPSYITHSFNFYGKDNKNIYYGADIIENADQKSFKVFSICYAKDNQYVYYRGEILKNADPLSFTDVKIAFAKDKTNVYYYGNVFSNCPNSFVLLKGRYVKYAKDSLNAYYIHPTLGVDTIENAIVKSFRSIGDLYATDDKSIFIGSSFFENSDPGTFAHIKDNFYKDKNNVYHQWHKLEKAIPESFKVIGRWYSKDSEHIYYQALLVPHANPEYFELVDNVCGKDKKNVYFTENIIPGADPKSFTALRYRWQMDDNFIYHDYEKKPLIDRNTFSLEPEAHDKNYSYNKFTGEPIK